MMQHDSATLSVELVNYENGSHVGESQGPGQEKRDFANKTSLFPLMADISTC